MNVFERIEQEEFQASKIKQNLTLKTERRLASSSLYYLLSTVLEYRDLFEGFHKPLCGTLQKYKDELN